MKKALVTAIVSLEETCGGQALQCRHFSCCQKADTAHLRLRKIQRILSHGSVAFTQ